MTYTVHMFYTDIVYTVDMGYTIDMVYTVDTVDTVYTIQTALYCLSSSMYAYHQGRLEADQVLSKVLDG